MCYPVMRRDYYNVGIPIFKYEKMSPGMQLRAGLGIFCF